jgi:LacI family transcriptional regulator
VQSREIEESWKAFKGPVVNISHSLAQPGFPSVFSNDRRIGELAARHFLERSFACFAFFGASRLEHSKERLAGFRQTVGKSGHTVQVYRNVNHPEFYHNLFQSPLDQWLRDLPKPCGIFCSDDDLANHLLDYLQFLKIEVPAELAILGVNNQLLTCSMARRSLSSVQINGEEIGRQAAKMLHGLLEGERPEEAVRKVQPLGVQERLSTDINGLSNPLLARALQYIARNANQPVNAQTMADSLGTSRRVLERNFKHHFGHGPYEEILRHRIRRAEQLLRDTDWKVQEIAAACGFNEPSILYTQFQRRNGMSPGKWRLHHARTEGD